MCNQIVYNQQLEMFDSNKCLERFVRDLNKLIDDGMAIDNVTYPVRYVTYLGDALERHKLLRLNASFSMSTYFSSFSYITQAARKEAVDVEELMPENFGFRTTESHAEDLEAIKNTNKKNYTHRAVKEDTILRKIKHFKPFETGSLPPCIMHDLFAGLVREDCVYVVRALFTSGLIDAKDFAMLYNDFKKGLTLYDKYDMIPCLRETSFDHVTKLPGLMVQNENFIRMLPLLLYERLIEHDFLNSEVWKFFISMKEVCEYILSYRLSETQVCDMEQKIKDFLQQRINMSMENDVTNIFGQMGTILPKHTFLLHYGHCTRRIGCLSHYHTNTAESKNAQLKRHVKASNSAVNVIHTAMKGDNQLQACFRKKGWFNAIDVIPLDYDTQLKQTDKAFHLIKCYEMKYGIQCLYCNKVQVNNITVVTGLNQVFMIHNATFNAWEFGLVEKILIPSTCSSSKDVQLVLKKTRKKYLPLLGLYEVCPTESDLSIVCFDDLAHFKPLYLYEKELKGVKKLLCTIKSQPILFQPNMQ